jgi:ABC-type arginine transport system ATPase subunit
LPPARRAGTDTAELSRIVLHRSDLAYLQCTSGSTSTPKGVVIAHGNVFGNAAALSQSVRLTPDSRMLSGLPHFHDYLALVTAYLEDRPYYVFDEWAADQDPEYKDIFYCKILPDLRNRGKAVVVITHDDRYFHLGTRVVALENGRIVDTSSRSATAGTHVVSAGAAG